MKYPQVPTPSQLVRDDIDVREILTPEVVVIGLAAISVTIRRIGRQLRTRAMSPFRMATMIETPDKSSGELR
jgi:hypothetical protein